MSVSTKHASDEASLLCVRVRRVWGTYHAGRISYLDVDPFEPSKCFGIEGRCVGAMFVLHPSAEIMLKFSYHHQVDGMVLLLLLLVGHCGWGVCTLPLILR